MSFKCVHISDIHFRGLTRHDEYRESFQAFFEKAKSLEPDAIFVGGDIVHSKTQGISPELIDILNWWFTGLAEIAPTHIILGNHDGLMMNKDRQDAISPIINALDNPRLFLYKKSGTYPIGVPGFNWAVFSCFDMDTWDEVKPVPGEINIATFHGGVEGSHTDINWKIEGEVNVEFFKDYEFTFLGDIHKLQYLDHEKRIAYPGSTIQQNYGEDPGKGFLFWEIEDKDNFRSTFYQIPHSKPFVTIDWVDDVQTTLDEAEKYPDGSRFRVRTNQQLSQHEIKQLHSALKEFKDATEIVYKNDIDVENTSVIKIGDGELFKDDLRDAKTHSKLMREYYSEIDLDDKEWDSLDDLINKYVPQISNGDAARNVKWSVKNFRFDNTFSYGKGNYINFDDLNGIIGLFGPNRSGKSSIPGSLMYTLFNTTDRGSIKNLHIINSRKGYCQGSVDMSINGQLYRIERQSTKHETRAGKLHAVTHLNLFKIDENGNVTQDLSGSQRTETEKIIRKLVGTSDDFLLTSMASQGEMNNFIKYKATQRKAVLTNFLNLNMFEEMLSAASNDSAHIKALIKNAPDHEWDHLIMQSNMTMGRKSNERDEIDNELSIKRKKLQDLTVSLATHKHKDMVTSEDVSEHQRKLQKSRSRLEDLVDRHAQASHEFDEINIRVEKINQIKEQFPVDELRERLEVQRDLEKTLRDLEHQRDLEKQLLDSKKKLAKKLEPCDCFEHLPTCQYVKQSDKHNKLLEKQKEKADALLDSVRATRKSIKVLVKEGLAEKLEKYDSILVKESELKIESSEMAVNLHSLSTEITTVKSLILEDEKLLNDMKLRISDGSIAEEVSLIKKKINDIKRNVSELDSQRMSLSESIGLLTSEVARLEKERDEFKDLMSQWKIYELFMNAVSKKGIPLQIITSQLPIINSEISKILQDVVGFTVELEAESNSNAMDIFINYGDSRRIIECGSGMEKMMASLAIRVALINISSLPKTNLLVIDEGFGALDAMNVEACNRLLISLKRWFRNILVISHVDGVKDIVDVVLDIRQHGKNSLIQCAGAEALSG
jgi:DNA repair exonuclease SbcCD ATPase subunit